MGASSDVLPFLTEPSLREVREALETQDDELADSVLRGSMGHGRAFAEDCRECNYLLGVIDARMGATNKAIAAFELAAQTEWSLQVDAQLHVIELALRLRDCGRADALLGQLNKRQLPEAYLAEPRIGVELCQGNWELAEKHLRTIAGASTEANRRAHFQLQLAQLLSERSVRGEVDRNQAIAESVLLIQQLLGQGAASSALLDRARALLGQLVGAAQDRGVEALVGQRTLLLEAMVDTRRWTEARQLAGELLLQGDSNPLHGEFRCRARFAIGRIAAASSERSSAIESFEWVAQHCLDPDLAARALFLCGQQQSGASQRTEAVSSYSELERRFPTHRLADDARLKQANLYRAMGSDSRFVVLIDSMPDAYPNGDMVAEGLFQLALKNLTERNWPGAIRILERAMRHSEASSQTTDAEHDRIRYFLAVAHMKAGQREAALPIWRNLIVERPLTYYMLLAYAAFLLSEPKQAEAALLEAQQSAGPLEAASLPDVVWRRKFERITALLNVGDVERADELMLESGSQQIYQARVMRIAGMYANAGATRTALRLAKRNGRDWRVRWPKADWMEVWKQAYPRPYRDIVRREAKRSGVSESLIYAVMREESEFDPKAASSADAYGLMQLILPTARIAGKELGVTVDAKTLQQPKVNIMLGARVLSGLSERFSGQLGLVAAGYNAGPGRPVRWLRNYPEVDADIWIELVEFPETRGYVKRVLESQAIYQWLYASDENIAPAVVRFPSRFESTRSK